MPAALWSVRKLRVSFGWEHTLLFLWVLHALGLQFGPDTVLLYGVDTDSTQGQDAEAHGHSYQGVVPDHKRLLVLVHVWNKGIQVSNTEYGRDIKGEL